MRTILQAVLLILFSGSVVLAQNSAFTRSGSALRKALPSERATGNANIKRSVPTSPLSAQVNVAGATNVGITGKWYTQTQSGGLHNIQVDPSNPNNIHVCAMQAFNVVPDDTLDASYYLNRRVYYVFSSDGGASWSTAKPIAGLRTGYPDMILMQRDGKYVPVIAAHRNVSDEGSDVSTALFIEAGNPGDGNFTYVEGSRVTYLDGLRDIIWPSIALSKDGTKVFVISAPFDNPIDYLQFGYFTLNAEKTGATFSGWKAGPAANDDRALASGGFYRIRVAASGKLGVVWQNYDYSTPDLGLYYSESTDEGTSWSTPTNVYFAHGTNYESNGESYSHVPDDGLDFLYDGEEPVVCFTGNLTNMIQPGNGAFYVPATGSLMFWRPGYADAKLLLWKVGDITTDLGDPVYDASFLSGWGASDVVDPEGQANLHFCTMATGTDPKTISIFFEAWVQDDIGDIGEFPGDPARSAYPFHSIWQMTTTDGGATWKDPAPVYANDLSGTERIDYRYPSVSTFNPSDATGNNYHIAFSADEAPGDNHGNGENNFTDVSIFFAKKYVARAKQTATPTFSLEQNYPNPVISGNLTTIPLSLENTEYVTLTITDVMGREISTVFNGQLGAGSHELPFSTGTLAAGMYQYVVKTSDATLSRSFLVTK